MNFIRKNQILKQLKYRNYSSQNNIKFYMIPYNEQYESRDNENEIISENNYIKRDNLSDYLKMKESKIKELKIKELIDNYPPYENKKYKDNVSGVLDKNLRYFYKYKYSIRH